MQSENGQRNSENDTRWLPLVVEKYESSAIEGLSVLFEPLQVRLGWRTLEEWESCKFCLCRFLNNIDVLYRVMLPELAAYASSPVKQTTRGEMLRESRYIWTCLRAIVRLLEQTEPYCQLINSFAYRMLEVLDGDDDVEQEQGVSGRYRNARRQQQTSSQEEWEQACSVLRELLNAWQRYQCRGQIFIGQFVDFVDDIPGLAQVDSAFSLLLYHSCSIFGQIILDFHAGSIDSDETIATLLLDMMQKLDLLLWQIDFLLGVLHPLVKLYAITAGMY